MLESLPMPPPGFDALTVEEQIEYVQSLWDYIAAHPEQVPVPDWHKQVLAERLASYQANPNEGEEFEKEVLKKLERLGMGQTIAAHFNGKDVLLDEAVELEPNTKLLVTVLPKDAEDEAWLSLSAKRLQDAYADEEEEYSVELIKEANPEYESR